MKYKKRFTYIAVCLQSWKRAFVRDRQRPDIHTAIVSERLASVEASITQVVTLPEPVPDAEPDRPVRVLPVRTWRVEERS